MTWMQIFVGKKTTNDNKYQNKTKQNVKVGLENQIYLKNTKVWYDWKTELPNVNVDKIELH